MPLLNADLLAVSLVCESVLRLVSWGGCFLGLYVYVWVGGGGLFFYSSILCDVCHPSLIA